MEVVEKYFPELSGNQRKQYGALFDLYMLWNDKINVISRKDIEQLYERHVLHSLAIAKIIDFVPGTLVLDVGTGGGFPGIPLAIFFPEVNFYLVDSIAKKIKVVNAVSEAVGLKNLKASHQRVQQVKEKYDFIVSRAVTNLPDFLNWTKGKKLPESKNKLQNGIIYLKGGDFNEELLKVNKKVTVFTISDFFEEAFFETKKVVHIY